MTQDNPRSIPARRQLLKGAVWSTPIVAIAAASPMAAASCRPGTGATDWSTGYTRASATAASGTTQTTGSQAVTFTVAASYAANIAPATSAGNESIAIGAGTSGVAPGFLITSTATVPTSGTNPDPAYIMSVTFTFNRPISNTNFSIFDIDTNDPQFGNVTEWIQVTNPGVTSVLGANLTTQGGWIGPRVRRNALNSDAAHAATFSIAAPTQAITIRMSRPGGVGDGGTVLRNFTFSVPC